MNPAKGITSTEQKVLNDVSMQRDRSVRLGDLLLTSVDKIKVGTPVNAIAATATLEVNNTVAPGGTITLGEDTYEFTARADKKVTDGNFPIDVYSKTSKGAGALTISVQPTAGDTVTIGELTYIFVPVGTDTAAREVSIGTSLAEAQEALVAAINGESEFDIPHPDVVASDFETNVMAVTAISGGLAGNAIVTTAVFTSNSNSFAAGTLSGGTNIPRADAITEFIAAVTLFDTQGITAVAGGNQYKADIKFMGALGNDIAISLTATNCKFSQDATKLAGGVNATVSSGAGFMIDANYLYVCPVPNDLGGTNWRRISLGSAF